MNEQKEKALCILPVLVAKV